jgi:hypothetical protein
MIADPTKITAQGMICRYAELNDGGLTIIGAGATRTAVGPVPPYRIGLFLAVLVHVPYTHTNENHPMAVELRCDIPTETEPSQRVPINILNQEWMQDREKEGKNYQFINVGRPASMAPGQETLVPYVVPVINRVVPGPGHYYFIITIDTEPVERVSFEVDALQVYGVMGALPGGG